MPEADDPKISITFNRYSQQRIDELVGSAIERHLDGVHCDDDGDEAGSAGNIRSTAKRLIEARIDAALEGWLAERVEGLVLERVEALISGEAFGKKRWDGSRDKLPPIEDQVAEFIRKPCWDTPREFGGGRKMTLVEFIAYKAASGQVTKEATRLVDEMRGMLSADIAKSLGDQMAARMLSKGR